MPYAESYYPSLDRPRRRPPPPVSPDVFLNTPSALAAAGVGAASSSVAPASPLLTNILGPRAEEQAPRYPLPQQRRPLDARQRRPQPRTQGVAVPEIVPPELRRSVALQGQRLNEPLREAGVNLSGPEYLAKLIQFESGWDPRASNPSSAFGLGQFIDSTAQDFRQRLGVETQDPARPRQMIKGASMHASGDFDYSPLYAGYNPGYSSTDPIPPVDVGGNVNVQVPQRRVERLSKGVDSGGARPLSVAELFYDPGTNIADGQETGAIGGHGTHVHFASERPRDVLTAAKIAERLGLEVDENPAFGGVEPVHTTGSHHYQERAIPEQLEPLARKVGAEGNTIGEALDITGDADAMMRLDQILAERSGAYIPPSSAGTTISPGGSFGGTAAAIGGAEGAGFGPYADLVQRQLGQIRRQGSIAPTAPMPEGRRALRPGEEDEDEETALAAMLGDRYRPQRRIAI